MTYVWGLTLKRNRVVGSVVVLAVCLIGGTLLIDHYRDYDVPVWSGTESDSDSIVPVSTTVDHAQAGLTPQSDSVPLQMVTAPPEQTIAFIDAKEYSPESNYRVTFVPYGIGQAPDSLVVMIYACTPQGTIAAPFDFTGQNAMVDTSRLPRERTITEGGIYEGTITLTEPENGLAPDGVLALMLVDVSAED